MPPKQTNPNQQKQNPNQQKQQSKPQQNNNNNNNNNTNNNSKPKEKSNKDQQQKQQQEPQGKSEQQQSDVPPVVTAIRTKQDITFISLPVQPSNFPTEPERLKCLIKNPTSELIWSSLGDRCAVCTTDGIMVYTIPINPGAEFTLQLHAILPYTTARHLQFSPLGNYLLSFETFTRSCPMNLLVWDLTQWSNNVFTGNPAANTEDEDGEGDDNIEKPTDSNPEQSPSSPTPTTTTTTTAASLPSVVYTMQQRQDLPTSQHSSVQWTDDEEYTFVLREIGEICCFRSNNMSSPLTTLKQKRLSAFQLSKIPRNGEKYHQHIALFSPCFNDEPAKCIIFKTLDIARGQSLKSGGVPDKNAPLFPPSPPVYGPLKPCQQVSIFRVNECNISWHSQSHALLLKTTFDDGSGQSYYGETRLYVVYVDREAVAVTFGNDSKAELHDAQWSPTHLEFTTLHGPAREAVITLWQIARAELYGPGTNGNSGGNNNTQQCTPLRVLGSGPFNIIRYHPGGRLILLTGIGSLSGKWEIWDKKSMVRLARGQDDDSPRTWMWSPCGRYILSATLFPFLRVGNQFKIQRFDGKILYQEKAKLSATTLSIQSESAITLAQQGPDQGHFLQVAPNYYPRTNLFNDVKISQELLKQAQTQMKIEPTGPPAGKYVPPHLRDQQQQNNAPTSPALPTHQNQAAVPRDLVKERKQGQVVDGFGARPLHLQQQQQQQQQPQQQQPKPQQSQQHNEFGAWRR